MSGTLSEGALRRLLAAAAADEASNLHGGAASPTLPEILNDTFQFLIANNCVSALGEWLVQRYF